MNNCLVWFVVHVLIILTSVRPNSVVLRYILKTANVSLHSLKKVNNTWYIMPVQFRLLSYVVFNVKSCLCFTLSLALIVSHYVSCVSFNTAQAEAHICVALISMELLVSTVSTNVLINTVNISIPPFFSVSDLFFPSLNCHCKNGWGVMDYV